MFDVFVSAAAPVAASSKAADFAQVFGAFGQWVRKYA
jgi:hypothetical protein